MARVASLFPCRVLSLLSEPCAFYYCWTFNVGAGAHKKIPFQVAHLPRESHLLVIRLFIKLHLSVVLTDCRSSNMAWSSDNGCTIDISNNFKRTLVSGLIKTHRQNQVNWDFLVPVWNVICLVTKLENGRQENIMKYITSLIFFVLFFVCLFLFLPRRQ